MSHNDGEDGKPGSQAPPSSTLPGGRAGHPGPAAPAPSGPPPQRPWPQQPQQPWPQQPQQPWPQQPPQQPWPQQPPQQPGWQQPQQPWPQHQQQPWPQPPQHVHPPPAVPLGAAPSAGFFAVSLKRAFRLKILPNEVLPAEKHALERATPPVTEPVVQAFLAWRRSLLFVIAVFLVPVIVLQGVEIFGADDPDNLVLKELMGTFNGLLMVSWLVSVGFAVVCWVALTRWTSWRSQRRLLLLAWVAYFLGPFVIHLYPLRATIDDMPGLDPQVRAEAAVAVGLTAAISVMISLAPKAISVMPGLMRAAIASKLLFPGAAAPGWLMVLAAPIYALLVYVVILIPFQVTGSGLFIVAVAGLVGAQVWQARLGYRLARPVSQQEAADLIARARVGYIAFNIAGLLFIALGLWKLAEIFDWSVLGVFNLMFQLFANVLLLTLVVTDIVVLSLERARDVSDDQRSRDILEVYQASLQNFMAADAAFTDPGGTPRPPGER